MIIFITTILLAAFVLFFKYQEFKKYKSTYDEILTNKKFKTFDSRKESYLFYGILFLFAALAIIFGIIDKDYTSIGMGIIIIALSLSEFSTAKYKNIYYYNDTHFIVEGKTIRYKSIKKVTIKNRFFMPSAVITTLNNENYQISKGFGHYLQSLKK